MELSDLFINDQKVIAFIKSDLSDIKPLNNVEKVFHPLVYHKFNKTLKNTEKKHTLYGKKVDLIYGYYDLKLKNEFPLYILLDIQKADVKMFSKLWGNPPNVPAEDYLSGDFDSQMWKKNGIDVIVGKSYADDYGADNHTVQISNIRLSRLYGGE